MQAKNGFSLLEIFLTTSVFAILAAAAAPIYQTLQARNDLNTTATAIAQALRRAQTQAQGVAGDQNWGVKIENGQEILFKGTSYLNRDLNSDLTINLAKSVNISGTLEIVFIKFTGYPQTTASITLTSLRNDKTQTMTVNERGVVNY